MGAKSEISEQILRAASDRIRHFGYAKTTMAEIAADLRMSAGNLYRFFASKLDIAEALAQGQRDKEYEALIEISQRSNLTAQEKLCTALLHDAKSIHSLVREQPRVVEIADIIAKERPHFIAERLQKERVVLCQIIQEGVQKGEFAKTENVEFLADCLQSAVFKFRLPAYAAVTDWDDLKRQMDGVLGMVMKGINCRMAP